jgi:hypothetical protein
MKLCWAGPPSWDSEGSFSIFLLLLLGVDLSHRLSVQLDAMGTVHDSVTDGIGDGGITEGFMIPLSLNALLV